MSPPKISPESFSGLGRLRRDDVPLRFLAAARWIFAGKVQEHLAIHLLRPRFLPVALEARRGEEELAAVLVQVALAILDQLRHLVVERGLLAQALHLPARVGERLPRVVEIAGRDAALLQLAPAAVVRLARRGHVTRRDGE